MLSGGKCQRTNTGLRSVRYKAILDGMMSYGGKGDHVQLGRPNVGILVRACLCGKEEHAFGFDVYVMDCHNMV